MDQGEPKGLLPRSKPGPLRRVTIEELLEKAWLNESGSMDQPVASAAADVVVDRAVAD